MDQMSGSRWLNNKTNQKKLIDYKGGAFKPKRHPKYLLSLSNVSEFVHSV